MGSWADIVDRLGSSGVLLFEVWNVRLSSVLQSVGGPALMVLFGYSMLAKTRGGANTWNWVTCGKGPSLGRLLGCGGEGSKFLSAIAWSVP
jgi:hypothetical protein